MLLLLLLLLVYFSKNHHESPRIYIRFPAFPQLFGQVGWCPECRLTAVAAAPGALGMSRQRRRAAGAGGLVSARGAAAARLVRAELLEAVWGMWSTGIPGSDSMDVPPI